jgi:hypothetical protein
LREQLRAERLDPIREVGQTLFHPPETLFVLSESPVYPLEPLEHLASNLLHPDHGGRDDCQLRAALSSQLSAVSSSARQPKADELR